MEKNPILLAQNLTIGYKTKKEAIIVAKDINIGLHKGSLTALIGANGIGKSTLLRTLSGIQKPLSGNVVLNNSNIEDHTPIKLAQQLSLVLTDRLPPSNLTVFELVALGRQPYTGWLGGLSAKDSTKITEALTLTDTLGFAQKKHFELSDGQLQKVLIARALAQDTPLIVLDEPTTHLDLPNKAALLKLLKKLAHEQQKCILFSTHDLDLALQLCDEIIVLSPQGPVQAPSATLIESGTIEQLFKNTEVYFDYNTKNFRIK